MKASLFKSTFALLLFLTELCFQNTAHGTSPDRHPRLEIAPGTPLKRGERIQPLAPKILSTNTTPNTHTIVETNRSLADTNSVIAFKDGSIFGFDKLAGFNIHIPEHLDYATNTTLADAEINSMIPAHIRAMDGRTILVDGYMTPLDYDSGKTKMFILSRNPSACCYGDMPLIHEMIEVRMKGEGVPARSYLPVQVRGVLRVGAKRNGDVLACIYRLDGETVDEAER